MPAAMGARALLRRAHYVPLALVAIYALVLCLLAVPAVQTELVFLHRVNFPFFADFAHPEKFGFAPGKTRNLRLQTSDGVELGAWHVLPQSVYKALDPFPPTAAPDEAVFDRALAERPTIIYFHGNAANRAAPYRVRTYSAFSAQLDCNVLAIDYRGFGDSAGTPSESGLLLDARAAWGDVVGRLARAGVERPEAQVVLVGHSLGTGVASGLAGALASEGIAPRAMVLIAPFTSISELLSTYRIFFVVPILGPLRAVPALQNWVRSFLKHPFDSSSALANTTAPTLIVHAADDADIPFTHGAALFERAAAAEPGAAVHVADYPGWGTVRSFGRAGAGKRRGGDDEADIGRGEGSGEGGGEVVFWQGVGGGHVSVGYREGTVDLIARVARL